MINVLYILTDFVFIFLPNSTVKLCETWHGQSHVYPEEEFTENVKSEAIALMPLEKAGNIILIMYFDRLCLYFSPKMYSKSW